MRVNGLHHVGLTVPSMDTALSYYATFGLRAHERDGHVAMRCDGRDQDQVVLHEGPDKRLRYVAFGISADDLPELRRRLAERDVAETDAPSGAPEVGVWFHDPDGVLVNVRPEPPAPPRPADATPANVPGRYERVDRARWEAVDGMPVKPRRLGHSLLFCSDIDRSERFYVEVLGLRRSDRVPGRVIFLNAGPGDHHVFGFIQNTHPGLHHTSFEVADVDEIARGAALMADKGHEIGWGLGRHTLGSNLFHYVRDPWGSWSEYFCDIDQISDAWTARDWDVPPAVWCPAMPERFLHNHEPKPEA